MTAKGERFRARLDEAQKINQAREDERHARSAKIEREKALSRQERRRRGIGRPTRLTSR